LSVDLERRILKIVKEMKNKKLALEPFCVEM